MADFARCMPVILKWEGGKVDDPRDPGGRTNQGIIQRVYDNYRRRKGLPRQDVYAMAPAERDEIYRTSYWNMVRGDQLPLGVDLVVFDGAVNSGPIQSIKWLQRALGVPDDGVFGPDTLHALTEEEDVDGLIVSIIDKRETFLKSLKTFKTFGAGWLNRTRDVEHIAMSWTEGPHVQTVQIVPEEPNSPKASPDDVKKPVKGVADVATGVGLGGLGLSPIIQQLQDTLTPYSFAGGWIAKLVIALAVLGALLTVGGLVWRWYATRKAAEAKS